MWPVLRNALRIPNFIGIRSISVTAVNNVKEIRTVKDGKTFFIEGVHVPSAREALLIKPEIHPTENGKKPCYLCALELDLKFTDVLIISQFMRSDGCMLPRRITGLCKRQQKKVTKLVAMAQKAGLLINLTPNHCKKDPTKRSEWKKFNTYYDEETIFEKKYYQPRGLMKYIPPAW